MSCEISECCQFINELMKAMPKVAYFHKKQICLDDFGSCAWYQTYRDAADGQVLRDFYHSSDMQKELEKIMRCLHEKMERSMGQPESVISTRTE